MKIRVRFAPSPTGYLHIGGARTALFNWLFARHHNGVFILRVEDTDAERSSDEMVAGILDGLRWLGLQWDEGPYFQSRRLELYRNISTRLLESGHAYRCFCTPELLENKKRAAQKAGTIWRYDGTCRKIPAAAVDSRVAKGEPFAVRFNVPPGLTVHFKDKVFGAIHVESDNVEDFVIVRSDGMPTYHLSVVSDDVDMEISHVIRGADHLSNTSKHVLLYRALEERVPIYAHLPLILGPDKKRLSKRHGATSVLEYRDRGTLPAALRNYLALLGWSPGGDREIFSDQEMIQAFDLTRINKANAVFDDEKLEWMNGKFISETKAEDLQPGVQKALTEAGLWNPEWQGEGSGHFLRVVDLLKSRTRTLGDFADFGKAFFTDDFDYDGEAVQKYFQNSDAGLTEALAELAAEYRRIEPFNLETTEKVLRSIGEQRGLKAGIFIGAVRVALTGKAVAPSLFEVVTTLGREKSVERIERAVRFLQ